MLIPPFKPKLPEIAECEQTPVVRNLLQLIAQQQEQIQRLEDEIRRLQGGPPRPLLKPNTLEPAGTVAAEAADGVAGDLPRRGPRRAKTAELTIHATHRVPLGAVPAGSRFKGYRRYVVQDLEIRTHNTCYLLEQWPLPSGESVTALAPVGVRGGHYGPQLVSYVLHQYYQAHVTQPLLLAQLHDWGIEISAGQLNRLLTEGHEAFHQEKAEIKAAGLAVSSYFQADDTGARHQGRNGYCTYIGNERFAWLASTDSKSRVNFLELLQAERRYEVNAEALDYMAQRGLAAGHREMLSARPVVLTDPKDWAAHLRRNLVEQPPRRGLGHRRRPDRRSGRARVRPGHRPGQRRCRPVRPVRAWPVLGPCRAALVAPGAPERVGPAGHRLGAPAALVPVSGPEGLPPASRPESQRPDHRRLRRAVRHGNDLRTAQSGPARSAAQPGRTAAGAGAPRLADPPQP